MPTLVDPDAVARVEVVRISTEEVLGFSNWDAMPGRILGSLVASDAQALVRQIIALPDGEQMRCFVPRYGARIWSDEELLAEAAICFKCHNALTFVDGQRGWFKFDADTVQAHDLLVAFQRFDPDPVLG